MNHSAQPDTQSALPSAIATEQAQLPPESDEASAQKFRTRWAIVGEQAARLARNTAVARPDLAMLALPPVLCGLALLFAQGATIDWLIAICLLVSSLCALAGIGAFSAARRHAATQAPQEWSPLRPLAIDAPEGSGEPSVAHEADATRIGIALLVIAAITAAPIALRGAAPALLVLGLGAVVVAFSVFARPLRRVAPLDEILTPLCLGPGLLSLTILANSEQMNAQDWLVACAIGAAALAVVVGARLRAHGESSEAASQSRRTLVTLLGHRGAVVLLGGAALVGNAFVLVVGVVQPGLPGALLALTAAPLGLLGLTGLAVSSFAPTQRKAAQQLARAYSWFGLALAVGITATAVTQQITSAIIHTFGG
ncbi:MAG TPA: hypothetical protein VF812_12280 [Ktedonobacterales bacterium]